jgi:hypothetical protein
MPEGDLVGQRSKYAGIKMLSGWFLIVVMDVYRQSSYRMKRIFLMLSLLPCLLMTVACKTAPIGAAAKGVND